MPKYALRELERRWLVELPFIAELCGGRRREIEDLYVSETRLRLRKIVEPGHEPIFKLCKKYGPTGDAGEWITNLYLSANEHTLLSGLPGALLRKARYSVAEGALDVFREPRLNFAISKMEFSDRASADCYEPPAFVAHEITGQAGYSGAALALEVGPRFL